MNNKLEIVLKDDKKKDIELATDIEISEYLTMLADRSKKIAERVDDIKKYVKTKRIDEEGFDDAGHLTLGNHRLTRYCAYRFDEKTLLENCTEEEKKVYESWKPIEGKYKKGTVIIKF